MAEERETDALLGRHNSSPILSDFPSTSPQPPTATNTDKPSPSQALRVIIIISTVLLITDLSGYAAFAPQLDIYEGIICRQYYAGIGNSITLDARGHLDQQKCKIATVQSELALINAWSDTFPQIPAKLTYTMFIGIILALPYGALADQIGRKPVLLLGMIGCILGEVWIKLVCWFAPTIPLRAVWFSALTTLIGGGTQTVSSLMWVMIADVCSVESRTTAFSQLSAAILIPQIIAIPISAALMAKSSWLPYLISFGMYFFAFFIALWVPETLPKNLRTEFLVVDESRPLQGNSQTESREDSVMNRFRGKTNRLQESIRAIRRNGNVLLVLFCFFISYLGKQAIPLVMQYAPKKFHWTIAQTSYLMSLRGSVTLILLFVFLPAISEFLSAKIKLDTGTKDKRITQGSLALCFVGCILIFFAVSTPTFIIGFVIRALGSSFQVTGRSLITSMVDQNLLGTVYTAIAAVTSGGMMVAGPLMAYAFRLGMEMDGIWLGMPFLVAASLYGVGFILISFAKVNR